MSDLSGMSDEDRKTIISTRFAEMASEYLNSEAGAKWFDEKVKAMTDAAKQHRQSQGQSPPESQSRPQQQQHSSGRVSAFEKFLLGR